MGASTTGPEIQVSQYTSPNRQMSVGESSNVEIPWLLSPKWHSTSQEQAKRLRAPPSVAVKSIREEYLSLKEDFTYPRFLWFEDASKGVPALNQSYVEVSQYLRQLDSLLAEVDTLRVSKEERSVPAQVSLEIRTSIEELRAWIESQRTEALLAEDALKKEKRDGNWLSECVVSWLVGAYQTWLRTSLLTCFLSDVTNGSVPPICTAFYHDSHIHLALTAMYTYDIPPNAMNLLSQYLNTRCQPVFTISIYVVIHKEYCTNNKTIDTRNEYPQTKIQK